MSNLYAEILEQIAQVKPVTVTTVVEGREGDIASGLRRSLSEGVCPVVDPKGRSFARVTAEYDGDTLTVCEPVMPKERLLVLGGGHIALPVCEFAAKCGFEVHVVDDRPEFANRSRFPDAADVTCDSFENGIRKFGVTPFDYVVVITRGHRHDADCLRVLLPGEEHICSVNYEEGTLTFFAVNYERGLIVMNAAPVKIDQPNCGVIVPLE